MLKQASLATVLAILISFPLAYGQPQNQQPPGQDRRENAQPNKSNPNAGANRSPVSFEIECDPNCTAKDAEENTNDSHIARLFLKTIDDPLTILTGCLAIATFLLVWVVLCQLRDARITSKRQLRAYVGPRKAQIIICNDGITFRGIYMLKNFGQSPASELSAFAGISVGEWPQKTKVRGGHITLPGGDPVTKTELWPTQEAEIGTGPSIISNDDRDAIIGKRKAVFLNGAIEYLDIFGGKVTTYFSRYKFGYDWLDGKPMSVSQMGNETIYHEG